MENRISDYEITDRLAQLLLRIVMENAGATKGGLSVEDGETFLSAATSGEDNVPQIVFVPDAPEAAMPEAIINHVRHSREIMILNDAGGDAGRFSADEYLQRVKPKSVLCMPIQRKERLLAVLYLENNLAAGIFTPERRTMIEMLASQAAVSIETSTVYEALWKSETLLNATQQLVKVGGWEYDVRSGKAFWTDELYRIHETPNEPDMDHIAESIKCYRMEDRPIIQEAFRKACENGEPYDLELPFTTFGGKHLWIRTIARPVYEKGKIVRVIGNVMDITEHKLAEEALLLNAERMEALLHLNQMAGAPLKEMMTYAFEAAVRLTRSKMGYFALMNEDETVLTMETWSTEAMAECEVPGIPRVYPVETTGLWGEAVRQRRPVITNDYAAPNPWKKGLPKGHVKVTRHMNLPVIVGGKIVLVAGVGNKEDEYTETDAQQLKLLMEGMWRLIERKRTEQALHESEQRYRLVFENSPVSIWEEDFSGVKTIFNELKKQGVLDLEDYFDRYPEVIQRCAESAKVVNVNQAALSLHGASNKDELLKGLVNTFTSESLSTFRKELVCLWNGGTEVTSDAVVKTLAGEPRHVSLYFSVCRGYEQTLSKVLVSLVDITERKSAENEVEHLKNHLANIIDSMPSMLVGIDKNDRITRWNRQVEVTTGIPSREAVGRPIQQMFPELSPHIEAMTREIKQHRPATFEKITIEEKGERRLYDLMLYPLLSNGVDGAVLRIEDVTEQTRIQNLMVQTEKMMSLGGLAAGMAHEINNPLGIIIQAAQNIERRVSPEIPANLTTAAELGVDIAGMKAYFEQRGIYDFVGSIRKASSRASRIIQNIIKFSRKAETIMQPESLAIILDQAMELAASDYDLKKKYDFRNIEIIRDYSPDIPDIPMIAVEMEQVILNVLKNAAQAMAANPRDRKPRMTIRLRRENRYALLKVEDNGPGMTEEIRRRVFEPFFTTKEPGIGTGLGLSVSYLIVTQNHKGLMEVESAPGNGTCFRVRLPLGSRSKTEASLTTGSSTEVRRQNYDTNIE